MPENNLSRKAYYLLEELLVTLQLEPGKTYSEKELMQLSGLSRTPLREALLSLSNERLLRIIPRRGIEISSINMKQQQAVLETRQILDTFLVKHACQLASRSEKQQILAFKPLMQETAITQNVIDFLRIDQELDKVIFAVAQNEFAAHAAIPLHIRSRRFWYYFKGSSDLSKDVLDHVALIDAVAMGNVAQAVSAAQKIIGTLADIVERHKHI